MVARSSPGPAPAADDRAGFGVGTHCQHTRLAGAYRDPAPADGGLDLCPLLLKLRIAVSAHVTAGC